MSMMSSLQQGESVELPDGTTLHGPLVDRDEKL